MIFTKQHSNRVCDEHRQSSASHHGFTLVELLVVVVILVILVGFTANLIRPFRKGRDIREAARSLNAYLTAAQARAIELQRPVGVWIRRFDARDPSLPPLSSPDPRSDMALELYMAEVPPPYTGDSLLSHAEIQSPGGAGSGPQPASSANLVDVSRPQTGRNDTGYFNLTMNDYIRFDYRGPLRRIRAYPTLDVNDPTMVSVDFEPAILHFNGSNSIPFQIFRYGRPNQSSVDPLQLPSNVAIDIGNSGIGRSGMFHSTTKTQNAGEDVAILFSPSGGIEFVIDGSPNGIPQPVTSAVHILIGRPDQVDNNSATPSKKTNLQDGDCVWVSIGHLNSRITTSELSFGTDSPNISEARRLAAAAQSMGGR